jgi:hypothetical protein
MREWHYEPGLQLSLLGMEMLRWTTHGIRDNEEGEYTFEQVKRLASKAGWVLLAHEESPSQQLFIDDVEDKEWMLDWGDGDWVQW